MACAASFLQEPQELIPLRQSIMTRMLMEMGGTGYFLLCLWLIAVFAPYVRAYRQGGGFALATVNSLLFGFIVQMMSWPAYHWFGLDHIPPHIALAAIPIFQDDPFEWYRFLSAAWLHSPTDMTHVLGNVLIIALVGVPLEQRLGSRNFMIAYIIGALGGSLAWHFTHIGHIGIAWGVSGAAYGLLGAYVASWPGDKIEFPLIIIRAWPVELIAFLYIMIEIARAGAVFGFSSAGDVAHIAHIGGFFAAAAISRPLAKTGPVPPFSKDSGPSQAGIESALRAGRKSRLGDVTSDPWQESEIDLSVKASKTMEKLRAEGDELETREAWLDKLSGEVQCPICEGDVKLVETGGVPQLRCISADGHLRWP